MFPDFYNSKISIFLLSNFFTFQFFYMDQFTFWRPASKARLGDPQNELVRYVPKNKDVKFSYPINYFSRSARKNTLREVTFVDNLILI